MKNNLFFSKSYDLSLFSYPLVKLLESLNLRFFILWERGRDRERDHRSFRIAREQTDIKCNALGITHNAWQSSCKKEDKLLWKWSHQYWLRILHKVGRISICYYHHFRCGHSLQDYIHQDRCGAGICFWLLFIALSSSGAHNLAFFARRTHFTFECIHSFVFIS